MKMTEKSCYNCGKKMHTAEQYHWHDVFLGDFTISCKREEYSYCDCGEERLSYSLCLRIEKAEQERISHAIVNMAHSNLAKLEGLLVTSHELEKILHVSRQAISKNGKLKTLVYHIIFKGKKYYLYESVMRFLKSGDGRFDLTSYVYTTTGDNSSTKQVGQTETANHVAKRVALPKTETSQFQEKFGLPLNGGFSSLRYNAYPQWPTYTKILQKGE